MRCQGLISFCCAEVQARVEEPAASCSTPSMTLNLFSSYASTTRQIYNDLALQELVETPA